MTAFWKDNGKWNDNGEKNNVNYSYGNEKPTTRLPSWALLEIHWDECMKTRMIEIHDGIIKETKQVISQKRRMVNVTRYEIKRRALLSPFLASRWRAPL
jgi:hypothetical protein